MEQNLQRVGQEGEREQETNSWMMVQERVGQDRHRDTAFWRVERERERWRMVQESVDTDKVV